jgi:sugar phosphate isomerase/epimerase
MRLGGHVVDRYEGAEGWVAELERLGYRAAYWPLDADVGAAVEDEYVAAARAADVAIAEVASWSNLISPEEEERRAAIAFSAGQLALADRVGARCCVTFAGSRSSTSRIDPHPENLADETFALLVDTIREVIDAVQPKRSHFTLEMMPSVFPDSVDSYRQLIRAIERQQFAVHLDPVNIMSSPRRYFDSAGLIRECVAKLGPWIRSCHVKDVIMAPETMTHIDEIPPGQGTLDFGALFSALDGLGDGDLPLMMEHMKTSEEYLEAGEHLRAAARTVGIAL